AAVFLWKLVPLVNADAAVGGHIMFVVYNRREQFVSIWIRRHAALENINSSGRHVEQMVKDTGADECIAVAIKIDAPGIARSCREHFKFFRPRLISGDRSSDLDPGGARLRNLHARMREDAVSHIQPTVRTPGEPVEQLVPIIQ